MAAYNAMTNRLNRGDPDTNVTCLPPFGQALFQGPPADPSANRERYMEPATQAGRWSSD